MLVWNIFVHSVLITVFVFVMMLLVDYFNVITNGKMSQMIRGGHWRQYFIASFLGSTPGCLGSFLNVSFYIHGLLSFGALVGSMIATSGDEAFVMLALFPDKALLLFGILFIAGILLGWLSDLIADRLHIEPCKECQLQQVHSIEAFQSFDRNQLVKDYLHISRTRAVLLLSISLILISLLLGYTGPNAWDWKRVTMVALTLVAAVIIGSVPDHYLYEHIWVHLIKKHIWRVFLWSFFALLFVGVGLKFWNVEAFIKAHMVWVLLISVLMGIIPESGPHMIFAVMFAKGVIPFSVLIASSIVQDGHGMLPLLSYTIKDSLLVKIFNLVFGLLIGLILYQFGI